ncbi:DNA replication complex GINS protein PSF3 [Condylostylus longicornis]|uniref:DNA replication complex GINS protein PSF3 n=1 Tax=Condylostylus longicornis TaxID=2530218 RepID=UPI00244E03AD|nr:DNA replication complex GINS protein PSF3 [Condylostylus longicornis]XP_055380315.1 DNA replication complex GINS protein PSF3 [Condylostylus longicornis]XP_055380316.1 DNA replication complex GINS protein PSF3 [Condylostylus longicornis]
MSYYPNYYSVDDILVTHERVPCNVNTKLLKMGFLDPGSETSDLEPGKSVNLPLWYLKELKPNNPYFSVQVPEIYKNVHKAVCEADATNIELGKLHQYFYEYGRHITPYDRNHIVGKIVFESMRQRVQHLLEICKSTTVDEKPELKLETLENGLYDQGVRTNTMFKDWLQFKTSSISASGLVQEYAKKRKRDAMSDNEDEENGGPAKRQTI